MEVKGKNLFDEENVRFSIKQQYTLKVNSKGNEVIRLQVVFDQVLPFVANHISELKLLQ